jgi:hypothetical protein
VVPFSVLSDSETVCARALSAQTTFRGMGKASAGERGQFAPCRPRDVSD